MSDVFCEVIPLLRVEQEREEEKLEIRGEIGAIGRVTVVVTLGTCNGCRDAR